MNKATGIELFVQILTIRFCTAMIVLGGLSYVGMMYYTDLRVSTAPSR